VTIIDDTIANALREAAQGFVPTRAAQDRIIECAATPAPSALTRMPTRVVRHRRALTIGAVAAAALLIAVPLTMGASPQRPATTSALSPNGTFGGGNILRNPLSGRAQGTAAPNLLPTYQTTHGVAKTASPSSSARIEETGSLAVTLHGRTINSAVRDLSSLAERQGGYVVSVNEHLGTAGAGSYSAGDMVIAVPQRQFNATVAQVSAIGAVSSLQSQSTNVTGTYVDLQSQLRSLQASRTQYLAIMSRAATIPEILAVQSQLDSIQSQIDQTEGQIGLLASETTYATLSVSMHVAGQPSEPASARRTSLDKAVTASVSGFVAGVDGLIRLVGPLLFAGVVLTAAYFAGRAIWRRRLP